MLKKTIKYTDYNGTERNEDFYFNFSKAELLEMELGTTGGLTKSIENIIAAKDTPSIINTMKRLVLDAYGEKSVDGRRFIKNQELKDAFEQTEAYSQLFMELSLDADAAAVFVNGVIPADLKETD